nr:hypothetical protein [Tanacetum cinerariifolium]
PLVTSSHVALYEDLKASMKRANRDEFLVEKDKSSKRHRDDQDPLPPPRFRAKKQSACDFEQPIKDTIMDNVNISDSEDIDTAHLPKLKTKPDWMKPVPDSSDAARTVNSESDVLYCGGGSGSGRLIVVGVAVAVKIGA